MARLERNCFIVLTGDRAHAARCCARMSAGDQRQPGQYIHPVSGWDPALECGEVQRTVIVPRPISLGEHERGVTRQLTLRSPLPALERDEGDESVDAFGACKTLVRRFPGAAPRPSLPCLPNGAKPHVLTSTSYCWQTRTHDSPAQHAREPSHFCFPPDS